jgi:hypothetical protein
MLLGECQSFSPSATLNQSGSQSSRITKTPQDVTGQLN